MKVYQDLTISGKPEDMLAFLDSLKQGANGWTLDNATPGYAMTSSREFAFAVPPKQGLKSATLYLHVNADNTSCLLANIVPPRGELSPEEYNSIVQTFYVDMAQAKASQYHLHVSLSAEDVFLEDTLSPENMHLLEQFAALANKATGSSYPSDYERWVGFIGASVRDRQILNAELLRQWLVEQGFPGDVTSDLYREYQLGVDLTKHWQNLPREQDAVGATR